MQDVCRAYLGDSSLKDDLLQEAVLVLLNKREDRKLLQAIKKDQGMYYFAAVVRTMATRKTHKFYYTFIRTKPVDKEHYSACREQDIDERLNDVDKIISEFRWYYKELWRLYFDESYSFTELSKETGISRKTLYNDITKLKEQVKGIYHDKINPSNG